MHKLIKISELCKILDLVDPKTKKPLNYVLRYWEKEFAQIKPKKINNQRYYGPKDIEIIKFIKSLIKDDKISIAGVKKILKSKVKNLDEYNSNGLDIKNFRINLRKRSQSIFYKIKKIKNYGKKNTS